MTIHSLRSVWLPLGPDARRMRLTLTGLLLVAAAVAQAPAPLCAQDARPQIAIDDPRWQLQSNTNGIEIYRATVTGTPIVPFKAVMTIPGTIEEVSLVLEDIPRRGDWISHYGQSMVLERGSDYDQVEYLRIAMPWPVIDRTTLIRVRISVSDDRSTATLAAESVDSHPRDSLPSLVRAQVYASTMQLKQIGEQVEVRSLVFIDPRGRIPLWAVHYYTSRVAQATLEGLRRQVARKLFSREQVEAMRSRISGYRVFRERYAAPSAPPSH